jgi:hypothetical protein
MNDLVVQNSVVSQLTTDAHVEWLFNMYCLDKRFLPSVTGENLCHFKEIAQRAYERSVACTSPKHPDYIGVLKYVFRANLVNEMHDRFGY